MCEFARFLELHSDRPHINCDNSNAFAIDENSEIKLRKKRNAKNTRRAFEKMEKKINLNEFAVDMMCLVGTK